MAQASPKRRHAGGRPPKFAEPSGPITVTLPDRTLTQLRSIDEDRAKAIVKAVDAAVRADVSEPLEAEVVEVAPGTGLVVVPPNRSLRSIEWLKMIEVAPTRYVIAITPGTPIEKVEVALMDLIDDARIAAPQEVRMLETLKEQIRHLRRGDRFSVAEILCVAM